MTTSVSYVTGDYDLEILIFNVYGSLLPLLDSNQPVLLLFLDITMWNDSVICWLTSQVVLCDMGGH